MRIALLYFVCATSPVSAMSPYDMLGRLFPSMFGPPSEPGSFDGNVAVLGDDNWQEAKERSNTRDWLVEFYAPWCGHCKALAPIYSEAASKIKSLRFAKIDATVHSGISKAAGVTGFPSVFWMRKGHLTRFSGSKTLEGFTDLAVRLSKPSVIFAETAQKLNDAIAEDELVKFILSAEKNDTSFLRNEFATVASRGHDVLTFLHATPEVTADVLNLQGAAIPTAKASVLRVEPGDNAVLFPVNEFSLSALSELSDWVEDHKYTTVINLTRSNFYRVTRAGRRTVLVVTSPDKTKAVPSGSAFVEEFRRIVRGEEPTISKDDADSLYFARMDGGITGLDRFLEQFDMTIEDLPRVIALDGVAKQYWYTGTATPDDVAALVRGMQDGTLAPHFQGMFWFVDSSWYIAKQYLPFLSILDFMPRLSLAFLFGLFLVAATSFYICGFCCEDDEEATRPHQD